MNATHYIAGFVQTFFHQYLAAQRGLSPNTVLGYKDCLKLLLRFTSKRLAKSADKLCIENFDEKIVIAFLDDLEATRGNCRRTRNTRLAALHSFFRYIADQEPAVMAQCQRICTIWTKRGGHKTIEYLEDNEIQALLDSVDNKSRNGLRDHALLLFLYNTGARAQEVVDLKLEDLRFEKPAQVKLTGKGRKERVVPLWPETVAALHNYLEVRSPAACDVASIFLNAGGRAITRFGIRYIVRKYAEKATRECPSLKAKKISPHTVRHST